MNVIYRIILFTFMLNIAFGLIAVFGLSAPTSYNTSMTSDMSTLQGVVTPDAPGDTSTSLWSRMLDFVTLGIYKKFMAFLNKYIFGIDNFAFTIFGDTYRPVTGIGISTFVRIFLSFSYAIGMIGMFTGGRNFFEG